MELLGVPGGAGVAREVHDAGAVGVGARDGRAVAERADASGGGAVEGRVEVVGEVLRAPVCVRGAERERVARGDGSGERPGVEVLEQRGSVDAHGGVCACGRARREHGDGCARLSAAGSLRLGEDGHEHGGARVVWVCGVCVVGAGCAVVSAELGRGSEGEQRAVCSAVVHESCVSRGAHVCGRVDVAGGVCGVLLEGVRAQLRGVERGSSSVPPRARSVCVSSVEEGVGVGVGRGEARGGGGVGGVSVVGVFVGVGEEDGGAGEERFVARVVARGDAGCGVGDVSSVRDDCGCVGVGGVVERVARVCVRGSAEHDVARGEREFCFAEVDCRGAVVERGGEQRVWVCCCVGVVVDARVGGGAGGWVVVELQGDTAIGSRVDGESGLAAGLCEYVSRVVCFGGGDECARVVSGDVERRGHGVGRDAGGRVFF